jgi:hypothetical protein
MVVTQRERLVNRLKTRLSMQTPAFKRDLRAIRQTIDAEQFEARQAKHQFTDLAQARQVHVYGQKYLDVDSFLAVNLARAYALDLPRAKPMRILDIGTGTGYFPFVCQHFGHTALALDMDDKPIYNDVIRFLGVDRRTWQVRAFEPLPDLGARFHLVTAFRIVFNQNSLPDQVWRVPQWSYFLEDLRQHQLVPNGRVYLDLNPEKDGKRYDPATREFFQRQGAGVVDSIVDFKAGVKPCDDTQRA